MADVPGAVEGEIGETWMEACRTKFVGVDGRPLPPPLRGHRAVS